MKISTAILRELGACESGFRDFRDVHGDKEILFSECVTSGSNSVSDYLWFIGKQDLSDGQIKDVKLFAVWCAKSCAHLFNTKFPDDDRVNAAITLAELAIQKPTEKNKRAARAAARAARAAAYAAYTADAADAADAAYAAAYAAYTARAAARAADAAARAAADAAARAAADAARVADAEQKEELARLPINWEKHYAN